jgi:hypothetical protein
MTDIILLSIAALLLVSMVLKNLPTVNKKQVPQKTRTASTLIQDLYNKKKRINERIKFIEDEIIYAKKTPNNKMALDVATLIEKRKILLREVDEIDRQINIIIIKMRK